jgi:hypothetical protein
MVSTRVPLKKLFAPVCHRAKLLCPLCLSVHHLLEIHRYDALTCGTGHAKCPFYPHHIDLLTFNLGTVEPCSLPTRVSCSPLPICGDGSGYGRRFRRSARGGSFNAWDVAVGCPRILAKLAAGELHGANATAEASDSAAITGNATWGRARCEEMATRHVGYSSRARCGSPTRSTGSTRAAAGSAAYGASPLPSSTAPMVQCAALRGRHAAALGIGLLPLFSCPATMGHHLFVEMRGQLRAACL